jgi:hypothetical protein
LAKTCRGGSQLRASSRMDKEKFPYFVLIGTAQQTIEKERNILGYCHQCMIPQSEIKGFMSSACYLTFAGLLAAYIPRFYRGPCQHEILTMTIFGSRIRHVRRTGLIHMCRAIGDTENHNQYAAWRRVSFSKLLVLMHSFYSVVK